MKSASLLRVLSALLLAIPIARPVAAAPGDTIYTHPGKIVSVDGRGINFYCKGSGNPTVVFDSGFEDWSPAWAVVQTRIANTTRACSYDRPGSGFSDPGLMPRTSVQIAEDLYAALRAGGIHGPYVLVGHSFGSYNIRTFLDLFPSKVAGMVIVDGEDGDVESSAEERLDDASVAQTLPLFKQCRAAIIADKQLPRQHFAGEHHSFVCNRIFFRKMPDPIFSSTLNAYIERVSRTQIPLWDEVISEMAQMPADERYLQTHIHRMGSKPLFVLTALDHFGNLSSLTAEQRAKVQLFERMNARAQAQWLKLSSNSRQLFAPRSGHYIEFEDPALVVYSVAATVRAVRAGR